MAVVASGMSQRIAVRRPGVSGTGAVLQRACACGGACARGDVPAVVADVLRTPGRPLDARTRADMEVRLGHEFSRIPARGSGPLTVGPADDAFEREARARAARVTGAAAATGSADGIDLRGVRVHTDAQAARSAVAVGAQAYTVGEHVVFGAGRWSPDTDAGRRLLAHELTHAMQQRGEPTRVQREGGEEPKATFTGCDDDRTAVLQKAIGAAKNLASGAARSFKADYPMTYALAAMKAHFGTLSRSQQATVIERYEDIRDTLETKSYACAATQKQSGQGAAKVDVCGQARCPGSDITVYPVFGKAECPAGPTLLHEAAHNAGACDDINRGRGYPPNASENNAYSYEYCAVDIAAGYKNPELPRRAPSTPR